MKKEREYMNTQDRRMTKKQIRKARNKKLLITLLAETIVMLALVVGYGVWYFNHSYDNMVVDDIPAEDIEMNEIVSESIDNYTNIALFGVDSRQTGYFGKGTHSDCIIVASINDKTKEVKMVSVYRDTYLEIAAGNSDEYSKANAAYFLGGPKGAIDTLNRNLDLNITEYATVDWKAITNAIDALGGVDVNVESNELDTLNMALLEQQESTGIKSNGVYETGALHLNGSQATAYARIRSTGQGDITRTERQREVISSMISEAKQSDLSTINKIIETVFPQISTSITKEQAIELATALFKYKLGDTSGFPYNFTPGSVKGSGSVLIPSDLENNVVLLHKFLFEEDAYEPSGKVKGISDNIKNKTGISNKVTGTELDELKGAEELGK